MNDVTAITAATPSRSLPAAGVVTASASVAEKSVQGDATPQTTVSAPPAREPDAPKVDVQESLKAAVAQMNEYIQASQRDLHFSYDADSGDTIVRVVDRNTQKVIRQIPDEIFLKLARNLNSHEPIHLFSAQA